MSMLLPCSVKVIHVLLFCVGIGESLHYRQWLTYDSLPYSDSDPQPILLLWWRHITKVLKWAVPPYAITQDSVDTQLFIYRMTARQNNLCFDSCMLISPFGVLKYTYMFKIVHWCMDKMNRSLYPHKVLLFTLQQITVCIARSVDLAFQKIQNQLIMSIICKIIKPMHNTDLTWEHLMSRVQRIKLLYGTNQAIAYISYIFARKSTFDICCR